MNFKLKGIPSIIIVILILIVFIYPVNTIEDFEFLSLLMLISAGEGLFIVLSFFYIGIKIPGLRKIAFFCAFGTFIYAIGTQLMQESLLVLLRATFGIQSQILFYFTHVCVQIIGLILFSYGISNFAYSRRKSKQESVKKTSTPLGIKVEESKISLIETLSQSKPAEITQDQVSLYREQNVCLVCKGQLNRYDVYLCPKCKVLYCENCAHSLENLENQCWVCGEPIDKSKPVKLSKEQEEDIKIK
ncbi:MAG: RING finger protein [Candidatus Hodarchaeota archaeon]